MNKKRRPMKTKNVHEPVEKAKSVFAKAGKTKIWKKLFSDQVDYKKIEEMKREMQMKYYYPRF